MPGEYIDVPSENPPKQIWKMLRMYLDQSHTVEQIRSMHEVPKEQAKNVEKQAAQIAYSIRQGEEYFKAAEGVSAATRPLLLYYGAVNLSRALTLMLLSGSHSIDALREAQRHQHHGLDLIKDGLRANSGHGASDFLAGIKCRIHLHEKTKEPWGHFAVFYGCTPTTTLLTPCEYVRVYPERIEKHMGRHLPTTTIPSKPLEEVSSRKLSVLEELSSLPDMYHYLLQHKIEPRVHPFSPRFQIIQRCTTVQGIIHEIGDSRRRLGFHISDLTAQQKEDFIVRYSAAFKSLKVTKTTENSVHFEMKEPSEAEKSLSANEHVPDTLSDIAGRHYLHRFPEHCFMEAHSHLLILFCFGMLSRYSPDIWMRAIDSNVAVAEIVDMFMDVCQRKFPNLMLNGITGNHYHVHLT
ncbi:MAG: YaaC family protein [Gemmataceae bacterium]